MTAHPADDSTIPDDLARYARQWRFAPLGKEGQRKLLAARVLIVGCGALGSVQANTLARAGVGQLRIIDRDFLELNNLQRQVLYDEDDVAAGLPKAIAAKNRLAKINSQIEIEAHVADLDHTNIETLIAGVDLLLDGTDNFETRYLLNDAAVKFNIPWVYGGCLGAEGQTLTILPGETPCLRCLMPDTPPPGSSPTCDTAGILSPIINIVASWQCCEAMKILSGHPEAISRTWTIFDLWDATIRQINLGKMDRAQCPTCSGQEYPWLNGERGSHTAVLCGRNAVQLSFPDRQNVSLEQMEAKLQPFGTVTRNRYLVRATIGSFQLTIFPDGRAVIGGTEEISEAKSLYARYIGN
ncbi:Molybdopterin-synthase adenylyltransferase [Anatilimnocola aggregata]|uniref:Molybdopterin-synthase adenylyltransferase n=1 Tax=Anatilimnocola aggregata TaxID=2528021 RepID=A0A517Y7C2_9BACT|nr:ThiF family adenylyltransferase [Anatilimnocola aggregata]QDU26131.1 Molybdopterin-synthase adenylyltransferase [Anatilimnocola aggregata]